MSDRKCLFSCYVFNTYISQEFKTPSIKIILYKVFLICNILERQGASSASAFVSTGLNSVGYQRFVKYLSVDMASYSGCNLKGLLYTKAPLKGLLYTCKCYSL
jgi:hypothetical protein